jgi:hypothetical protein
MQRPLTFWQKLIAYSSLAFVMAWTVFGLFAIWTILTRDS